MIAELRARGVTLAADGDRLRCRPRHLLAAEDLERLRAQKAEVLDRLRSESAVSATDERLETWVVYRTKTGKLDVHHLMLAHSIDPKDVVARVKARDGATALQIAAADG